MKLAITVNIQQHIGGPAIFLSWIGYTPRIHSDDIIITVDKGPVGMTKKDHIAAMLSGHLLNAHRIKTHTVPVSMGHKYFMPPDNDNFFGRHRREEIVIAADHVHRAWRNFLDISLAAFQISQMKHQVQRSNKAKRLFQVTIFSMCVADN